ncbi:hypothetical protein HOLleu_25734 [Holothuria leucospilota]|uniref:Uncharacterized protein n=1 Tax=Holothuria leucospilota TaxID=206669 RepID=A0A9Q1BT22_HOLLE|nr:hypothetical protein HOLleu_25734 [Holothuria leucospilota]
MLSHFLPEFFVAIVAGVIVIFILFVVISFMMWKNVKGWSYECGQEISTPCAMTPAPYFGIARIMRKKKPKQESNLDYSDSSSKIQINIGMYENVRHGEFTDSESYYENVNCPLGGDSSTLIFDSSLNKQQSGIYSEETHTQKNRDTPDGQYEVPDINRANEDPDFSPYSYADPKELFLCLK